MKALEVMRPTEATPSQKVPYAPVIEFIVNGVSSRGGLGAQLARGGEGGLGAQLAGGGGGGLGAQLAGGGGGDWEHSWQGGGGGGGGGLGAHLCGLCGYDSCSYPTALVVGRGRQGDV